ncbi:MAG: nitroreductase family protein, partial [Vallitaleaceae bacterium]|nr:nitroreductase family protein [Vallitaleaceae bacterium]
YSFEEGAKIGTYGFIKNAKAYIIAIAKKAMAEDKKKAVDFGYDFEQIILKATDLGFDTCWMAMSFNHQEIINMLGLSNDEHIMMVSPLGYGLTPKGFQKLTRMVIKADHRLDFEKLFFNKEFSHGLTKAEAGDYEKPLSMLRLAPSAGNSQPWRVVMTDEGFDFYVKPKPYYESRKNQRINLGYNDLGIAKMHFEYVAKKYNLSGSWIVKEEAPLSELAYAYSWIRA